MARSALYSVLAASLFTQAGVSNCPNGTAGACNFCLTPNTVHAGSPGLTCPVSPGSIGLSPTCTQWFAGSDTTCQDSLMNATCSKYFCCEEGDTGYWACVFEVNCVPGVPGETICYKICCIFAPTITSQLLDCGRLTYFVTCGI